MDIFSLNNIDTDIFSVDHRHDVRCVPEVIVEMELKRCGRRSRAGPDRIGDFIIYGAKNHPNTQVLMKNKTFDCGVQKK